MYDDLVSYWIWKCLFWTRLVRERRKTVKKILWFSRHQMTDDQLADLRRIFGQIEVKQESCTASSAKEVAQLGKDCDILAVVLPPSLLADLLNPRLSEGKPVIRAIANRVPTGNTVKNPATGKEEQEFRFEHAGWERVLKIEVVTERL